MATRIQYDFIGRKEYGEEQARPKLSMNLNNDDNFQEYVINGSPLEKIRTDLKKIGKNAPNHDLLDAILYCHQSVSDLAKKIEDPAKISAYFSDLIKFLRDSVIAVRLTVPQRVKCISCF